MFPAKREKFDSVIAFTSDVMIVSYAAKIRRNVVVLSTMHDQPEIDEGEARKPAVILDYNSTKGAVDSFDQKIGCYSCYRTSNRWPMRLFYFLVDTGCLNGFVVFTHKNPTWRNHKSANRLDKRRLFLIDVGEQLAMPFARQRSGMARIARRPQIARAMGALGLLPVATESAAKEDLDCRKRGRCSACPWQSGRKSENRCVKCSSFVCGEHAVKEVVYRCISCPADSTDDEDC